MRGTATACGRPRNGPASAAWRTIENLLIGYRRHDANGILATFPFGHGLSFTNCSYTDSVVTSSLCSVTITNTRDRAGAERPQLYLSFPPDEGVPPWQLRGFSAVSLLPGGSQVVSFPLTDDAT